MLHGIGAHVYVEARKEEDLSWINAYGYNGINLNELDESLDNYDFIFNTIPHLILDRNRLIKLKSNCVIIDLASKPGGEDFENARRQKK